MFEVPNAWHRAACEETRSDVELQFLVNKVGLSIQIRAALDGPQPVDDLNDDEAAADPEKAIGNALGHEVEQARRRYKLSQRALAERVGVNQSMISTWERGDAVPRVDHIFRLDLAFGFQPGTLLSNAGLIKLASQRPDGSASEDAPANVSRIEFHFDTGDSAEVQLPPNLSLDQWRELARTMLVDEIEAGASVTKMVVGQPDDYESSMTTRSKGNDIEELLRRLEIMLEAQGEVDPPRHPTYDTSSEPF